VLRRTLLTLSRSHRIRHVVETAPVTRGVVRRFVAGATAEEAVTATRTLVESGRAVTLDHLGEDTLDRTQAEAIRDAYLTLLRLLSEAGLTAGAEVSVKLSAVGQSLPKDGEKIARLVDEFDIKTAPAAGTTVTLDMEDHTATDATLAAFRALRVDFPAVGTVVQAYLRRTEDDCRDLAASEGARVRLCKGAYREPTSVAFQNKADVDMSYVRCLRILMRGNGYPMVATHDPRLVAIAGAMALQAGRAKGQYEYQMLFGVRPDEQRRLAERGEKIRVYVPYGTQWYPYLTRRLAERPANVAFFVRAVATRK